MIFNKSCVNIRFYLTIMWHQRLPFYSSMHKITVALIFYLKFLNFYQSPALFIPAVVSCNAFLNYTIPRCNRSALNSTKISILRFASCERNVGIPLQIKGLNDKRIYLKLNIVWRLVCHIQSNECNTIFNIGEWYGTIVCFLWGELEINLLIVFFYRILSKLKEINAIN